MHLIIIIIIITNRLIAIVHTKPVIAILVPNLAVSSLDSLTPKTYP